MKILTREFDKKEKILLVVLLVIIMALCYYKFVYTPIKDDIAEANTQADNLENEKIIADAKLAEMLAMQEEIDSIEADGSIALMPSYNNAKSEVAFLNDVMADAVSYDINIDGVTRDGDQIRRNISISFTTNSYEQAENIICDLETCDTRCLVSNVSVTSPIDDLTASGQFIQVSATATFYETVVGGTVDSGLPDLPVETAGSDESDE